MKQLVILLSASILTIWPHFTQATATLHLEEALSNSESLLQGQQNSDDQSIENNTTSEDANNNDKLDNESSDNSGFFYAKNSHCEINGKEVPCEEVLEEAFNFTNTLLQSNPFFQESESWMPQLIKFGLKAMFIGFILSIFWFAFWLWMLIDAIKYEKENRVMWILIIVFFSFLGALVYLFATKIGRKEKLENKE